MNTQRPMAITAAAVLQALLSLADLAISIPELLSGGTAPDGPPAFVMALGVVIGALGLVAALGLWRGKRWGIVATIILRVIDSLSAAPGLVFAPTMSLRLAAVLGIALSIVVIVLVLLPASRRAYA
jgi:uncharacterized membrane protein (DUF2068 family)